MKKKFVTAAAALTLGVALAVAAPLAASAHVTLAANTAAAGSFTMLEFKVPNESATESTATVIATLPSDTPFAFVSYVPVPGWSTELVTTTLDTPVEGAYGPITEPVTSIVWTADPGSEIAAGQLQIFPVSVGPVPDTGSIVIPVAQTYTDGEVVSWNEEGEDAEHPAPVLFVNDAPADDHHGDDDASLEATETGSTAPAASDDVLARVLGIAGLVVGAVGIVLAITGRRKTSAE